jgi:hypothetical protein
MRFVTAILILLLVTTLGFAKYTEKPWTAPVQSSENLLDSTDAVTIGLNTVVYGNTVDGQHNVDYYSTVGWPMTGREIVYVLDVPGPATWNVGISIDSGFVDLDVFVLRSSNEGDGIFHLDTGEADILTPGRYFIVVDGYNGAVGPFEMHVMSREIRDACCPTEEHCAVFDFNTCSVPMSYSVCGGTEWVWEYEVSDLDPEVECEGGPVGIVMGTILNGDYMPNSGDIGYITEDVHISVEDNCSCLEICHWYNMVGSFDGGNVKISTDGGVTWDILIPQDGYPGMLNGANVCIPDELAFTGSNGDAYARDCFDLTLYDGMDIRIGFFFGSDEAVEDTGWYIKWFKFGGPFENPVEDTSWGSIKALYR